MLCAVHPLTLPSPRRSVKGIPNLRHFTTDCRLQPHDTFLDAGCGIGRIAIPLTAYLSTEGRYDGFDIVASSVEWCREHIGRRHDNFNFQHADIFNTYYNPDGKIKATDFVFPYAGDRFDVVFAGSLFTHLLPNQTKQYIYEIARVLKPGGRFLGTFFFLTVGSLAALNAGKSTLDFFSEQSDCRVVDPTVPEAAVACDVQVIHDCFDAAGLVVRGIWFGTWSDRSLTGTSAYQDMALVEKPPAD